MKTLFISIMMLCSIAAYSQDYNVERDIYVNAVLDGRLVDYDVHNSTLFNAVYYTLQYYQLKISVSHYKYVPYGQKEEWVFTAKKEDGGSVLLDGMHVDNKVHPRTLERIKRICLNL